MKKISFLLILIGLVLLGAGTVLQFSGGPARAGAPLAQACRDEMKHRGTTDPATLAQCDDVNFATMITAKDAQSAARAISATNTSEIGGNSAAMFLIGLGIALALGGALTLRRTPTPGG